MKDGTLWVTPYNAKWIKDQMWHKDQLWHKDQMWHKDPNVILLKDGFLEITFPVSEFSEIKREILRHGSDVGVVKPKDLRKLIKSEA